MHGCLEDLAKLVWMECTWRLASASAACGEPMTLARICSVWPSIQARPIRCVARVAHLALDSLVARRAGAPHASHLGGSQVSQELHSART